MDIYLYIIYIHVYIHGYIDIHAHTKSQNVLVPVYQKSGSLADPLTKYTTTAGSGSLMNHRMIQKLSRPEGAGYTGQETPLSSGSFYEKNFYFP